jgi:hypothetical protein
MNTVFHFRSTKFNCTEPKDYFINPNCYGDDVATWLMQELGEYGIQLTGNLDQEDFGWFFTFMMGDVEHCVVIGFQPNDPGLGDRWIGSVERHVGFFGSISGQRDTNINPIAVQALDSILRKSDDVELIGWFENA